MPQTLEIKNSVVRLFLEIKKSVMGLFLEIKGYQCMSKHIQYIDRK